MEASTETGLEVSLTPAEQESAAASLLSMVEQLYAEGGMYGTLTQLQHALQCAKQARPPARPWIANRLAHPVGRWLSRVGLARPWVSSRLQAEDAGADDATIIAALLHDVGWMLAKKKTVPASPPFPRAPARTTNLRDSLRGRLIAGPRHAAGAAVVTFSPAPRPCPCPCPCAPVPVPVSARAVQPDELFKDTGVDARPTDDCLAAQLGILAHCGVQEGAGEEQLRAQHDVIGGVSHAPCWPPAHPRAQSPASDVTAHALLAHRAAQAPGCECGGCTRRWRTWCAHTRAYCGALLAGTRRGGASRPRAKPRPSSCSVLVAVCVARKVEGHVLAKRFLTATEPEYFAGLSKDSVRTLGFQGGHVHSRHGPSFHPMHPHSGAS